MRESLLEGEGGEERLELFTREAAMEASIRHPHIVTIYDLDFQGARRIPFIVMELLNGIDLEAELKHSGPLGLLRFF